MIFIMCPSCVGTGVLKILDQFATSAGPGYLANGPCQICKGSARICVDVKMVESRGVEPLSPGCKPGILATKLRSHPIYLS